MTTKRVTMIKLKEILRLKCEAKLSLRQIARSLGLSTGVISKYLKRAEAAGLSWPLPEGMSDAKLEARLQPERLRAVSSGLAEPDFVEMESELKRKGMTRQLLWEEYAETPPILLLLQLALLPVYLGLMIGSDSGVTISVRIFAYCEHPFLPSVNTEFYPL